MTVDYPLVWRVKVIRPEWFGRRCRIVIHGGRGNRLIEFDDGQRVVCPGTYLRRAAQRRDVCPCCGGERVELVVVPGRFYCSTCQTATPGPVAAADVSAGTQLTLEAS